MPGRSSVVVLLPGLFFARRSQLVAHLLGLPQPNRHPSEGSGPVRRQEPGGAPPAERGRQVFEGKKIAGTPISRPMWNPMRIYRTAATRMISTAARFASSAYLFGHGVINPPLLRSLKLPFILLSIRFPMSHIWSLLGSYRLRVTRLTAPFSCLQDRGMPIWCDTGYRLLCKLPPSTFPDGGSLATIFHLHEYAGGTLTPGTTLVMSSSRRGWEVDSMYALDSRPSGW